MGLGTVISNYGTNYNRYKGYAGASGKSREEMIDDFYSGLSSAAERTTGKGSGEVLGLTMIPYGNTDISYGMTAMYSEASTAEEPVIRVSCNYGGENVAYDVRVNEVNPRNASCLEMFALMCYQDDQGLTDGGSFGSFQRMKAYAANAQMNGYCSGITGGEAISTPQDWIGLLQRMAQDYFGNAATYEQGLDCRKLAAGLEKWCSRLEKSDSKAELINEFSEAEWDDLIAKTDAQIDAMKETVKAETEQKLEAIEKERHRREAEDVRTEAAQSVNAAGKAEGVNEAGSVKAQDRDAVSYTKVTHRNSWDDPDTRQTEYSGYNAYTFYTAEGIFYLKSGCNTRDREYSDTVEWSIKFESGDDYDRVMDWLSRFPESDSKRFAANENFWKDFLSGELDEEGFMAYYAESDHGVPRVLVVDEEGNYRIDRDVLASPYFRYFNETSFTPLSVEEVTQRLLDRSAIERQGGEYRNPTGGKSLQSAVWDLFSDAGNRTYRFAGETGSYHLQEWLTELINRSRGGLMEELLGKKSLNAG